MKSGMARKTGLALSLVLSLLGAQTAYARWAKLLQVKPGMAEEPSISVKRLVSPDAKDCTLTLGNLDSGERHAWLIRADRELSPAEQEMRNYLWDHPAGKVTPWPKQMTYPVRAPIKSITVQVPTSVDVKTVSPENQLSGAGEELQFILVYKVTLPKAEAKNAYLYIDYPTAISDGGWFYSVDLGAFCAQPDDAH